MNVLIISGSFYPTNTPRSFRATELAKELMSLGNDVTVLIPQTTYDYNEFCNRYPMSIKFYNRVPERRKYVGISIIDRAIFHYSHWLINHPAKQSMKKVEQALKGESGYDLLITIAFPHYIHWAVGNLYKKGHKIAKTWIADCGDPFMLSGTDANKPPFWFKPLEIRWCTSCDFISVPTETSYKGYYPEFKDKIRVIPQGFNFDDVKLPQYKKNDVPTFAFTGSIIPGKRDPRCLLEWLSIVETPFRFHVYGNGASFFTPYQDQLGSKLVIHESVSRDELLPILSQMDFLLNIGNGTNVQTPSKLIDYTLVKRPILTIESDNVKENVFSEFLAGDYSHMDSPIDISQFDIHNVVQQFLKLCEADD